MKPCSLLLLLLLAPIGMRAQCAADTTVSDKVITNARMIAVGATNILDTYLSPEKYRGTSVRYISHTTRDKDGSPWARTIEHEGELAYADNRAGEGGEMAGAYTFRYGVHYRWSFLEDRLHLRGGLLGAVRLGFLYNVRGSNNPAQLQAALHVDPSFAADYRFPLFGIPFTARYEASAPIVGLMFSPHYGQSYYEIFQRGNYDRNVVVTTVGSTPSLRQSLSLDFPLLRLTWRIGYLCDINQAKVNQLKSHAYTHAFMIGVVKRFKLVKIRP